MTKIRCGIREYVNGIRDLIKIQCLIQENTKYLDSKRDLIATRGAAFIKIWARDAGFVFPVCQKFDVAKTRIKKRLRGEGEGEGKGKGKRTVRVRGKVLFYSLYRNERKKLSSKPNITTEIKSTI